MREGSIEESMKQPDLEVNIKFDNSLGTEERFAFRRWLEGFIEFVNGMDVSDLQKYFAENFEAFGFMDERQVKEEFLKYFLDRRKKGTLRWMKFSKLSVRKKFDVYTVRGLVEAFSEDMLVLEGEVEMQVTKSDFVAPWQAGQDEWKFVFSFFTLSPRMRVSF